MMVENGDKLGKVIIIGLTEEKILNSYQKEKEKSKYSRKVVGNFNAVIS